MRSFTPLVLRSAGQQPQDVSSDINTSESMVVVVPQTLSQVASQTLSQMAYLGRVLARFRTSSTCQWGSFVTLWRPTYGLLTGVLENLPSLYAAPDHW